MKFLLLSFLMLVSAHSMAYSPRVFGLINTSMSFIDHGSLDNGNDIRYEADMDGAGYGIGAEYKVYSTASGISFNPGFIYELERDTDQVTTVAPSSANSSQSSTPKIQMTTVYGNGHIPVSDKISLVAGITYHIPEVDASGAFKGYDIKSGIGYQYGVDFKLQESFFVQMMNRRIVLDSEDDSYDGKADLSNFSLIIGKQF